MVYPVFVSHDRDRSHNVACHADALEWFSRAGYHVCFEAMAWQPNFKIRCLCDAHTWCHLLLVCLWRTAAPALRLRLFAESCGRDWNFVRGYEGYVCQWTKCIHNGFLWMLQKRSNSKLIRHDFSLLTTTKSTLRVSTLHYLPDSSVQQQYCTTNETVSGRAESAKELSWIVTARKTLRRPCKGVLNRHNGTTKTDKRRWIDSG